MAITVSTAKIEFGLQVDAANTTSGTKFTRLWDAIQSRDFQSSGSYIFDGLVSVHDKSLTSASNLDIDVYDLGTWDIGNGAGRDSLGLAHANASIVYMMIKNSASSAGNLVLNTSVANGWTAWLPSGTHTLTPGAAVIGYWPDGLAVTDAANHILRLTASGGDVTYDFEMCSSST